jgi:hypothetical protein
MLTRALAAVLPHEDYLLPRWNPPTRMIVPLQEIVIHGEGRFHHVISLVWK